MSAWIRLIEQTSLKQIYLQLIRKSLGTAGLDKWFEHLNYPSITPYHHLCLMRVTGMLHTLPALSGKGRNTPRTHLQSIAGHTPLTHTHTEGTFSASDQLNLHVWLWEDTVLEEKVQKKREHIFFLLWSCEANCYKSVQNLTSGKWSTEWDGRTKSGFPGHIQIYICQRSNSGQKQRHSKWCQRCYITNNTRRQ